MDAANSESFKKGLTRYFSKNQLDSLARITVGIAGAGGLGSNIAMLLARCGVENFLIIDHDYIDPSNLNRQHYWPEQIGQPKVTALQQHLKNLNGSIKVSPHIIKLSPDNINNFIPGAPLWLEALDDGAIKKIFVECALMHGVKTIAASGIAGCGGPPLKTRKIGNLYLVGDMQTSIAHAPPLAPRVMQAAAMMADLALQIILDHKI